MKKILLLAVTITGLGLAPAFAQFGMGAGAQGPHFDGALDKLFGDTKAFSATMEFQTAGAGTNAVIMPGAFSFDTGKSRFEMNIGEVQGSMITPDMAQQFKMMGMDTTIAISRPDLKVTYLVCPGLNSYTETASQETSGSSSPDDYKIETAELGKETMTGHDCVKHKVTVTDKAGDKHEFTVWNATDLKNFPVKITMDEKGRPASMLYKNVSFTKPAASLFEVPSGFTKYNDLQTMMQTEVMKKMGGGGMGMPPVQH